MEINDFIESFNTPIVHVQYFEFGLSQVTYNGYDVTEEFYQLQEFKDDLKSNSDIFIEKITKFKSDLFLDKIKKQLLLIIEKIQCKNEIYTHSTIKYQQYGESEYLKKQDTDWSYFHPNELSDFIKEHLYTLQSVLLTIDSIDQYETINSTVTNKKGLKIIINEDHKLKIFENLKPYFQNSDHDKLKTLIDGKTIDRKLNFNSNGNKLGDVFRRLKSHNMIINEKGEIIDWIINHFNYLYREKVTSYNKMNLQKIINTTEDPLIKCAYPIGYFKETYPILNVKFYVLQAS